ncbi:nucleotidyltransferase domain-containing protein [Kribbella sp. C-35]|uniref:nucleotidyltransferase domain-containing protein n=1 Tax=Kribbella sp. C-35 TaxID=2789276 RepID=UPI00397BBE8B
MAETVPALQAEGVWLVGSLGSGRHDEWSDVDIIVVGRERVLDETLLTLEMPGNGPVGGGYVGAMYDIGSLPLWVDWYWWPSGSPLPRESRLVAGAGTAGRLDLSETLELVGRGLPGPVPDPDVFALAMLPLAAKHIARGDLEKAAAMASMLNAPSDVGVGAGLSVVLSRVEGHETASAAVRRYLEVVKAIAGPGPWE